MKHFVLRTILFLAPFLLLSLNYILLSATRDKSGDLGKMADIFFEKGYHDRINENQNQNENENHQVVDVDISAIPANTFIVTFGDSFSNTKPYRYQNAISQKINSTVFNIRYNLRYSPEEAAYSFLANADDSLLPRVIIVESVERESVPRLCWLGTDIPFDSLMAGNKQSSATKEKRLDIEIMEYYQRRIRCDVNSQIVVSSLDKPFFTAKGMEQKLISYANDTIHYTGEQLDQAIINLAKLHSLAIKRNVELVYLIIPNKSSVYAPHTDNDIFYSPLSGNSPFDTIPYVANPLEKMRTILESDGTKDLYFADDTHWTPQTARIAGHLLEKFLISNQQFNNSTINNSTYPQ